MAVTDKQYLISIKADTKDAEKLITAMDEVSRRAKELGLSVKKTSGQMKMAGQSSQNLAGRMAKLAVRAAVVAPIWMTIRAAIMAARNSINNVLGAIGDLDAGMRKVSAVLRDTGGDMSGVYEELEMKALSAFSQTARGLNEVTEAMYQLGTAGRSNEEVLKGFVHILNLAVGTFGNVRDAGRVVSGILNVFEGQLKEVGNTEQQIQYITDLLATAWKNNQVELNEVGKSMQFLASVGNSLNIRFEHLIAASSVLNDAMLRGGKGGRLLARALIQVSKNSEKLRNLGVLFDPNKPLDFLDVMNQLHQLYEEQAGSQEFLNDLVDVFGVRGVRSVTGILTQWEKWQEELGRTREEIKNTAGELKKIAESDVRSNIIKLGRLIQVNMIDKLDAVSDKWQKFLDSLANTEKETSRAREEIKRYRDLGEQVVKIMDGNVSALTEAAFFVEKWNGAYQDSINKLLLIADLDEKILFDNKRIKSIIGDELGEYDRLAVFAIKYSLNLSKIKTKSEFVAELTKKMADRGRELGNIIFIVENIFGKLGDHTKLIVKTFTELQKKQVMVKKEAKETKDIKAEELEIEKELDEIIGEQLKKKRKVATVEDEITKRLSKKQSREVQEIVNAAKLRDLKIEGATGAEIAERKLFDLVNKINQTTRDTAKFRELSEEEQLKRLINWEEIVNAGLDDLDEMALKILQAGVGWGNASKIVDKMAERINAIDKDIGKFSDKLEKSFAKAFGDLLKGEDDINAFFNRITENWRNLVLENIAGSLTDELFDVTDLGGQFGGVMTGIRDMFKSPVQVAGGNMEKSIVKGSIKGGEILARSISGALGTTGALAGAGIGPGGVGISPSAVGGAPSTVPTFPGSTGFVGVPQNFQNFWQRMTGKQKFGAGLNVGMAAFGGFQSAGGGAAGIGAGVAGGAGAIAGLAGNPQLAVALMLVSTVFGMFNKKTVTAIEENEVTTSSKLDVTNKQLEILNRNVVGLKNTFEPYAMPESFYFSQKPGTGVQVQTMNIKVGSDANGDEVVKAIQENFNVAKLRILQG